MENPGKRRFCGHCGKILQPGATAWRLRGELFADFDGALPPVSDPEGLEAEKNRALNDIADKEEAELNREVHRPVELLLCPPCRLIFEREWLELRRPDPNLQIVH